MEHAGGQPICRRLRTKAYYVTGPDDVDLVDFSSAAAYWCAENVTVLGPDDIFCAPQACQPGRSCFEPG